MSVCLQGSDCSAGRGRPIAANSARKDESSDEEPSPEPELSDAFEGEEEIGAEATSSAWVSCDDCDKWRRVEKAPTHPTTPPHAL